MQATLPVPAARAGRRRSPALPVLAVLVLALPALLAAGCKSSSLTDMSDKPTDPGIAAALRVTEQRMQRMFDELLANPVVPFAEFDGIHYRPILAQVQEAKRRARIHDRPDHVQREIAELESNFERMRRQHRQRMLSGTEVSDFHEQFNRQLEALLRMERR